MAAYLIIFSIIYTVSSSFSTSAITVTKMDSYEQCELMKKTLDDANAAIKKRKLTYSEPIITCSQLPQ